MTKISAYPPNNSPQTTDYVLGNSATGPATRKFLLSDLITLFLNNIPAAEGGFGFVSSGGIWSGDAYGSTRAASMTAMRVKVNTNFLSISAVTARIFTASRDTYIDVLDNGDGTGSLVYTDVANNATSPTLAANSIRIAIVVTGASTIASVASINQGQVDKALPANTAVTDMLGNLICPRDPNRTLLGYRQLISNSGTIGTTEADFILTPFIMPTSAVGRKVKAKLQIPQAIPIGDTRVNLSIKESTAYLNTIYFYAGTIGQQGHVETTEEPSAGLHTYKGSASLTSGTFYIYADSSTAQAFLKVELQ